MNTDRELQEAILAALENEPGVHAEHIGVSVADGVVTLQGVAGTLAEKYRAEEVARGVHAVRAIANDIEVPSRVLPTPTDGELAAAAAAVLSWNHELPEGAVQATVRGGWVTLTGSVGWEEQRSAAERAIRGLDGVVGISNGVLIEPLRHSTIDG